MKAVIRDIGLGCIGDIDASEVEVDLDEAGIRFTFPATGYISIRRDDCIKNKICIRIFKTMDNPKIEILEN
jgi:hypothetical protein